MLNKKLVESISTSFHKGKSIRRNLSLNSKLVIDQKLPYLCVYRFTHYPDPRLASLITSQGAYLFANSQLDISELLESLVKNAVKDFKSYMIVEIWQDEDPPLNKKLKLLFPGEKAIPAITAMEKGFKGFSQILPGFKVILEESEHRHPATLPPLISLDLIKNTGSLLIGIVIPSLQIDKRNKNNYPLFFRKFRRKFSDVIKMGAFEFIRVQAENRFEHYLMLGKTRMDNPGRSADKKIAEISEKLDFILNVTPINTQTEWEHFQKNKYDKTPHFIYRLVPVDPEIEKRKLFSIPIENIEHPALAFLLRDKRMELEKQLIMLEERGSKKFFHTSQSIYGDIEEQVKSEALSILNDNLPNEQSEFNLANAVEFAKAAEAELEKYRKEFPQLELRVNVKDTISGLVVSGPELSIGSDFNISASRVNALVQHEVGTHLLTYCNGHRQPLHLMYAGLAGYEQIQEGLAVLSEFLVGGLTINRLKLLAARVMAVNAMVHGADFIETFNMLSNEYGFSDKTSFIITMRVFRGGGLTKDAIYLKGLMQLMDYIKNGGDIKLLYGGKFALEQLPLVQELVHLKILKKHLLPEWLTKKQVIEKINLIKKGIRLEALVNTTI